MKSFTATRIQHTLEMLKQLGLFDKDINDAILFAVTQQLKSIATSAISESRTKVNELLSTFDHEIVNTSFDIFPIKTNNNAKQ